MRKFALAVLLLGLMVGISQAASYWSGSSTGQFIISHDDDGSINFSTATPQYVITAVDVSPSTSGYASGSAYLLLIDTNPPQVNSYDADESTCAGGCGYNYASNYLPGVSFASHTLLTAPIDIIASTVTAHGNMRPYLINQGKGIQPRWGTLLLIDGSPSAEFRWTVYLEPAYGYRR